MTGTQSRNRARRLSRMLFWALSVFNAAMFGACAYTVLALARAGSLGFGAACAAAGAAFAIVALVALFRQARR